MPKTEGPRLYGVTFRQCSERTAEGKRQDKVLPVHFMKRREIELDAPAALPPGGRTLVSVTH
jgi:hypothetical protein